MLSPSEEVTKTWVKGKGILIKNRPQPSRFSYAVCLTIVFSIAFGFLGGFITAGFALDENYSTVYENLLAELESTRKCLERERKKLTLGQNETPPPSDAVVSYASSKRYGLERQNNQVRDQAMIGAFENAANLFKKSDIPGGCAQLNHILNLPSEYNGEWKNKALYLRNKTCR